MINCKQETQDSEDCPEEITDYSVAIQYEGSEANMCPKQQVFVFRELRLKQ